MSSTQTDTRWFEMVDYGDPFLEDDGSVDVYSHITGYRYFVRVREDDGSFIITQLTDDNAQLVGGEARLSRVSEDVVAATVDAMLR